MLIADDMLVNRKLLKRSFKLAWPRWIVDEALFAEDALEMAAKSTYSLIIMDLHFGPACMRGSTAISELRLREAGHVPAAQSTVIIACTGNAASEGADLLARGADAVWDKPFPSVSDGSLQSAVADIFAARRTTDT